MVPVNRELIDDALQWLDTIRAGGNSYLLQALKVSQGEGPLKVSLAIVFSVVDVDFVRDPNMNIQD